MAKVILASKSPRRLELISMLGITPRVFVSDFDEGSVTASSPTELVKALSLGKAEGVSDKVEGECIIIGSDTVVELDGKILGKPKDNDEAFAMLSSLSGTCHSVHTGLTVIYKNKTVSVCETTKVYMRKLSPAEIQSYISTADPLDKAGAYGIQGYAGCFIEKIDGDYYTVMGLPLCTLVKILRDSFGLSLSSLND